MIIFGWRTRQKTLNVLRGQCPVCHAERDIHDQSNRVWFTLSFCQSSDSYRGPTPSLFALRDDLSCEYND